MTLSLRQFQVKSEDKSSFKSKEQGDAHQVRELYLQVCSSALLHLTPFLILSQISTTRQSLAGLSSSPPCTLCWLPWPATTGAWARSAEEGDCFEDGLLTSKCNEVRYQFVRDIQTTMAGFRSALTGGFGGGGFQSEQRHQSGQIKRVKSEQMGRKVAVVQPVSWKM